MTQTTTLGVLIINGNKPQHCIAENVQPVKMGLEIMRIMLAERFIKNPISR